MALARASSALPGASPLTDVELQSMALRWAYRSTKAKRVLGWSPSPHEECLEQTIAWYREREPNAVRAPGTRQPLGLRAAGGAVRRTEAVLGRIMQG